MKAYIQPNMILWTRKRAGFSVENSAKKLNVTPARFELWERGDDFPTLRQAQDIAKTMHVPLGWLYLQNPPQETVILPDLRTVRDGERVELSVDFRDQLNEVLYKQQEYLELIIEEGAEPRPFIGKYSVRDEINAVVADIRTVLGLDNEMRRTAKNGGDFLRAFIHRAESVGILVMRSGIVGGNTHRALSVEEFRGFAISDAYAPVVFLNGKDAPAAQIFTLAHELVHLWIGESGISNQAMNYSGGTQKQIEVFCNKVAAELLVPADEMKYLWNAAKEPQENIHELTRHFRVSGLVLLYRAKDLNYINRSVFDELYRIEAARHRRKKNDNGGPPPVMTVPVRNSRLLTDTVLVAAYEGRMLFRDACRTLGTTMTTLNKLASEAGVI
ncbi:MAG: ImmA/IrrE family metallo-endopeptidase [Kiritimatiellales bacterium]